MRTFTVAGVSALLEVSEESVRRWIREGKLNATRKLGRTGHTIYMRDLVAFANQQPLLYLDKVKKILNMEGIPYEVVMGPRGSSLRLESGTTQEVTGSFGPGARDTIPLWDDDDDAFITREAPKGRATRQVTEDFGPSEEAQKDMDAKEQLWEKIRRERIRIIRMQQEADKLRAQLQKVESEIGISEGEISYYKLMLETL